MKKVKGFISGLVLGAVATFYGIWNWEKSNKKRISVIADKYYKEAKTYSDNLLEEYGPDAKEKIDSILADTKAYLNKTLHISKKEATKILDQLKKDLTKQADELAKRFAKAKNVIKK